MTMTFLLFLLRESIFEKASPASAVKMRKWESFIY